VAGPYTKPDPIKNVHKAIDVANLLMDMGHVPFVPHMSHFFHILHERPWEYWLQQDLEWLPVCDALLRIPGESRGADLEVAEALRRGIPVYRSLDELNNV